MKQSRARAEHEKYRRLEHGPRERTSCNPEYQGLETAGTLALRKLTGGLSRGGEGVRV